MADWIDVAPVSEFGPGQSRLIDIEGAAVAIFNIGGEYFALEDKCSHAGTPMLGSGLEPEEIIDGDQIICPRHGARFCIRTGAALCPPAYEPAACFPARVFNGVVQTRDDRRD